MCACLGIFLVVYILSDRGQSYLFFFCYVLREQKEKNKVCILTVYQDVMTFFLLKDPKND